MLNERFRIYSDSYSKDIVDENTKRNYNQNENFEDICDLLNEQENTIKKLKTASEMLSKIIIGTENTIDKRIADLEKSLKEEDNIPSWSPFHNPMSNEYRKEYIEEIRTLEWVQRTMEGYKQKTIKIKEEEE